MSQSSEDTEEEKMSLLAHPSGKELYQMVTDC